MNIAIYDSNPTVVGFLEEVVYECFKSNESNFSCDGFLSGEELLTYFGHSQEKYQLYILGLQKDREADWTLISHIGSMDPYATIIVVNGDKEITEEILRIPVFRFLYQPLEKKAVRDVLLQAMANANMRRQVYVVKTGKKEREIPFLDIRYFTCGLWKKYIHMEKERIAVGDSREKILSHVTGNGFAEVNHSYIVNMEYIEKIERGRIFLDDQKEIKLAEKYREGFNRAYRKFAAARIW